MATHLIGAALFASIAIASPAFAHGHHFSNLSGIPRADGTPFENGAVHSPHDLERSDPREKQNPYDKMSCQQLYMLATQSQNADLADAMADKECGAL
ncbi:MAG: hypothetical protein ACTHLR_01890 [Rhizomicrobium sp.]